MSGFELRTVPFVVLNKKDDPEYKPDRERIITGLFAPKPRKCGQDALPQT